METETLFDVMGLPRRYELDLARLEQLYLERSKQHHPDRHAKAAPTERARALLKSTELNDAYRTLKHPVKRAEYLLKLEGFDLGDEEPQRAGAPRATVKLGPLDPRLLGEIMELREELDEARGAAAKSRIEELSRGVRAKADEAIERVRAGFRAFDECHERARLDGVAAALMALRYYQRFLDEAEAYEDAEDEAMLHQEKR